MTYELVCYDDVMGDIIMTSLLRHGWGLLLKMSGIIKGWKWRLEVWNDVLFAWK